MKRNYCIILISAFLCLSDNVNAQTLTRYAKQRNQELAERQRLEKSNYEKACQDGSLSALNEYLNMYPKGKYIKDIKSRIAYIERKIEQEYYENACSKETTQAYQDYINRYPSGRFVKEARGRIDDMVLWQSAKSTNTIDSYKNYLSKSANQSFANLAKEAITDLEAKNEWNSIKHTTSKSTIENFIVKYPKSSCISDATKRHDELSAVEFYENGNYERALEKFDAAGGKYSLEYNNRSKYDTCVEYMDFRKLSSDSKEDVLLGFLKKYPSSKYYDQVSNMVAVAKAKNFTMYSSNYNFSDALAYVKDNYTRNTVESYIDRAKHSYSQYKRSQRHSRVMANGGYVKLGLEFMDFGIGLKKTSEDDISAENLYYNLGLSVKFGNYASPIQLEFGIKPGAMRVNYTLTENNDYYDYYHDYTYDFSYDYSESKTYFHMPVFAKLKLNICSAGESKFYVAGLGTYNAIRDKLFENEFSVGGGLGFARKKWDWFVLYYKQDLENKQHYDDKYIGTSFVYYF